MTQGQHVTRADARTSPTNGDRPRHTRQLRTKGGLLLVPGLA